MSANENPSPAVEVAKEISNKDGILVLDDGVRIRIRPVSAALISDVSARVKDPEPPIVFIKDKDRSEPNTSDPGYVRGLEIASQKRGMAVIDAMVMFGVELLDGIPSDESWLRRLKFMENKGMIDLGGYDLNDPFEREFLYKRYVVVNNNIITQISKASGLSSEDVERAKDSFQRS